MNSKGTKPDWEIAFDPFGTALVLCRKGTDLEMFKVLPVVNERDKLASFQAHFL